MSVPQCYKYYVTQCYNVIITSINQIIEITQFFVSMLHIHPFSVHYTALQIENKRHCVNVRDQ